MSQFTFQKAVKQQEKLRMALDGPAGAGKTWTALIIGSYLAEQTGGRIAVIDSERSSAKKYASDFDFDHLTLPDWSPHTYMGAVRSATEQGYAVIIIDSFSHAWEGVLELKDNATARSRSKNSYTEGWREATPVHSQLVDTVLRADAHVIATLRTKTEYVINDKGGVDKIGLKPVQREGVDFEFDVVGDMTAENAMVISKTRCSALTGQVIRKPDQRIAETLWAWLNDGDPYVAPPAPPAMADEAQLEAIFSRARSLDDAAKAALGEWRDAEGLTIKAGALSAVDADRVIAKLAEIGDQDRGGAEAPDPSDVDEAEGAPDDGESAGAADPPAAPAPTADPAPPAGSTYTLDDLNLILADTKGVGPVKAVRRYNEIAAAVGCPTVDELDEIVPGPALDELCAWLLNHQPDPSPDGGGAGPAGEGVSGQTGPGVNEEAATGPAAVPDDAIPASQARRNRMHALAGQAWPDEQPGMHADARRGRRLALATHLCGRDIDSTSHLTDMEMEQMIDALESVVAGRTELAQDARGAWVLRPIVGGSAA